MHAKNPTTNLERLFHEPNRLALMSALASTGAVRTNEYYVSQYLDHAPLQHASRGWLIATRHASAAIPEATTWVEPGLGDLLLRRQDVDELLETSVEKAPAALQVPDQALRLVLRGDADLPDAGIDAIGQREIDDAELAAERHGRFRAPVGELHETAAAASCQHQSHGILGQCADESW